MPIFWLIVLCNDEPVAADGFRDNWFPNNLLWSSWVLAQYAIWIEPGASYVTVGRKWLELCISFYWTEKYSRRSRTWKSWNMAQRFSSLFSSYFSFVFRNFPQTSATIIISSFLVPIPEMRKRQKMTEIFKCCNARFKALNIGRCPVYALVTLKLINNNSYTLSNTVFAEG